MSTKALYQIVQFPGWTANLPSLASIRLVVDWKQASVLLAALVISIAVLRPHLATILRFLGLTPVAKPSETAPDCFFRLPRELRDRVYENLAAEHGAVAFSFAQESGLASAFDGFDVDHDVDKDRPMFDPSFVGLNLLHMNRSASANCPADSRLARSVAPSPGLAVWERSPISSLFSVDWTNVFRSKPRWRSGAAFLLTNRQLYEEYALSLCRNSKLIFKISNVDCESMVPVFTFRQLVGGPARSMAPHVRDLELTIELHPKPGPTVDSIESYGTSPVFQKSVEFIAQFGHLRRLRIHIVVCGAVMVNPVVKWQSLSRHFMPLFPGPDMSISFTLSNWACKTNHLHRPSAGEIAKTGKSTAEWGWRCPNNHHVHAHTPHHRPMLYFYSSLYHDCQCC